MSLLPPVVSPMEQNAIASTSEGSATIHAEAQTRPSLTARAGALRGLARSRRHDAPEPVSLRNSKAHRGFAL